MNDRRARKLAEQPPLGHRIALAAKRALRSGKTQLVQFDSVQCDCIAPDALLELVPTHDQKHQPDGLLVLVRKGHASEIEDLKQHAQLVRSITRKLITTQETERSRVATALHNNLGQTIAALSINLDLIEQLARSGALTQLSSRIKEVRRQTQQTAEFVRTALSELRPPALEVLGIVEAVRGLARHAREALRIDVSVSVTGRAPKLDSRVGLALYRIAEEAIVNTARHSGTREVEVELRFSGRKAFIDVSDRGQGFHSTVERRGAVRGLGLHLMRERAQAAGGDILIASAPGGGTRVSATLPTKP